MTAKLKPSELGCGVPYRLTYSGQVFASSETRALLADYIRAYKASVEQVVLYFSEVIRRGEGDEQHIADTEVWREVMGKESDYVTLKKGGDLKVIYTMAGYGVKTRVGECLAHLVKQFNLGIRDLTLEKVEALFIPFSRCSTLEFGTTAIPPTACAASNAFACPGLFSSL